MVFLPWGKKRETLRRAEDILLECTKHLGLSEKKFTNSGRDWVMRRRWGDDPAEMQRLIYYAALTAPGRDVDSVHFPPRLPKDHEAHSHAQFEGLALEEIVRQKISHFFVRLEKIEARDVHSTVVRQIEKPLIKECLKWAQGNQVKAARVLGINRNTLRKKIKELNLKEE